MPDDSTGTTYTHPDPAVQALINDGWLGTWEYPVSVDDIVSAVGLVRQFDRQQAPLLRTDYAACTVLTGGKRDRIETGTDRLQAEAFVRNAINAGMTMHRDTLAALGVIGHVIEQRQVWQLPDGYELTGPWHEPATATDR